MICVECKNNKINDFRIEIEWVYSHVHKINNNGEISKIYTKQALTETDCDKSIMLVCSCGTEYIFMVKESNYHDVYAVIRDTMGDYICIDKYYYNLLKEKNHKFETLWVKDN